MKSAVAGLWKLTVTNWEPTSKLILLKLHKKLLKNSMLTILWYLALKQIGKVKKFYKWVLYGLTEKQTIIVLKCHLLFYATTNNFSIQSWCARKNRFYMTPGDDQLSAWAEKNLWSPSQNQTCTRKKVMITAWWSAAGLIHCSFLNPDESITIWEVCSASQWDAAKPAMPSAGIGKQNGSNSSLRQHRLHIAQPTLQKLNKLGYKVLPHPTFTQSLTSWLLLLGASQQHFFRENASKSSRMQKMLSAPNSQAWIFVLQERTNLFLVGKNALIVMVPILINNDVFEPSYDDLNSWSKTTITFIPT